MERQEAIEKCNKKGSPFDAGSLFGALCARIVWHRRSHERFRTSYVSAAIDDVECGFRICHVTEYQLSLPRTSSRESESSAAASVSSSSAGASSPDGLSSAAFFAAARIAARIFSVSSNSSGV